MEFFVPACSDGNEAEKIYRQLADMAETSPLPHGKRIYSVQFEHNGETWKAAVGERLLRVEPKTYTPDNATVIAIFGGNPYVFVTNAPPISRAVTEWSNPFYIGANSDQLVEYFLLDQEV